MGLNHKNILFYSRVFAKLAEVGATVPGGATTPASGISYKEQDIEMPEYLKDIDSGSFNMNNFRSLNEHPIIDYYLERTLPPVGGGKGSGEGSGRRTYDLGNGNVIKFAYDPSSGIYQNKKEAQLSSQSDLFADVKEIGPNVLWILVEKITPFTSVEEFAQATGISADVIEAIGLDYFLNKGEEALGIGGITEQGVSFLKEMIRLHDEFKLISGDLTDITHWGRNQEGKVKTFDYGLDKAGYEKMYTRTGYRVQDIKTEKDLHKLLGISPEDYDRGVRITEIPESQANILKGLEIEPSEWGLDVVPDPTPEQIAERKRKRAFLRMVEMNKLAFMAGA